MKKQLIISALSFATILLINTSVKAQTPAAQTATTAMTITLADVISIDPTSTAVGGNVAFDYVDEAAYRAEQTDQNSLTITSTVPFDVNVKAGGPTFLGSGTAGGETIPVGVMTISSASSIGATPTPVTLTDENQALVTGATIGSEKVLVLDYTISATKGSSTDILGKKAGSYKQDVTYTVSAN